MKTSQMLLVKQQIMDMKVVRADAGQQIAQGE